MTTRSSAENRVTERRIEKRKLPDPVKSSNSTASDVKKSKTKQTTADYDEFAGEQPGKRPQQYIRPPTLRIDPPTPQPLTLDQLQQSDSDSDEISFNTPANQLGILEDSQPLVADQSLDAGIMTSTQSSDPTGQDPDDIPGGGDFPVNKPNFPTGHRGRSC